VTEVPWLTPDGDLRCFLCETRAAYPGRDRDPDWVSVRLRDSHRLLWSKPLPDGRVLQLSALKRADYLKVVSPPEGWTVGSDNFATTHANALPVFSAGLDGFTDRHLCGLCSIGGYIVFPNQRAQQLPTTVNETARPWSLNQVRGMERRISDRFDLTLEAIRLSYEGILLRSENPIGDVLEAYRWWFELFGKGAEGFRRFADFFFLTPMLDSGGGVTAFGRLGLAFDHALPKDDESAYTEYIVDQLSFVADRNQLITDWPSERK
jgi:hypothetical protein